jgi:hypothetical protein
MGLDGMDPVTGVNILNSVGFWKLQGRVRAMHSGFVFSRRRAKIVFLRFSTSTVLVGFLREKIKDRHLHHAGGAKERK